MMSVEYGNRWKISRIEVFVLLVKKFPSFIRLQIFHHLVEILTDPEHVPHLLVRTHCRLLMLVLQPRHRQHQGPHTIGVLIFNRIVQSIESSLVLLIDIRACINQHLRDLSMPPYARPHQGAFLSVVYAEDRQLVHQQGRPHFLPIAFLDLIEDFLAEFVGLLAEQANSDDIFWSHLEFLELIQYNLNILSEFVPDQVLAHLFLPVCLFGCEMMVGFGFWLEAYLEILQFGD